MKKSGRLLVMLACACLLASCGGGSSDDSPSCSPAPAITTTPPTTVVVNQLYQYHVEFTLACVPFFTCGYELVQAPSGAGIDPRQSVVFWLPDASEANHTVPFTIATFDDFCGDRATQSWTVNVSP